MFCLQCGAQVEEGLAFCTNCGAKLGNAQPQAPAAAPQPQAQPQYTQPQAQPQYTQPQAQPQYTQPQAQPQYAQPQAQPQYTQPQAQPQYAQPQAQPQYGQAQYSQPQYGQPQPQYGQPQYGQPQYGAPAPKSVSFVDAIKLFFVNYVNFNGRATKSEFWWSYLFTALVSFVLGWIPVLGGLIALGIMLPSLSVSIRRLHDTGKSWVYILMGLIPFAGAIILIIQFCKDSDGNNQWGPAPRSW